jgi:N-methylhydantoinase A/oxoprolinase/acetone carboxylase beta subunit
MDRLHSGSEPFIRIGIDVGGTNTDAVILADHKVIARCKRTTTADIGSGVIEALSALLTQSGIERSRIQAVMIGTTQFTNAFVEGRGLNPVGILRIGAPATMDLPPMVDWPARLRGAFFTEAHIVRGGFGFDGREANPLDEAAVIAAAKSFLKGGIRSIAVASVFAPMNDAHEQRARDLIGSIIPGAAVTLSRDIGRIGLLERESAAIMNAALDQMGGVVLAAFGTALAALQIDCPFFVCQNDGTLMTPAKARQFPILTFASGPTNSIRGAGFLTGCEDCVVIDVGGTTSDFGVLRGGLPRESSVAVDVGGIRTNFQMPDVLALGIGGGSVVAYDASTGATVGPQSVGHELNSKALVFGGDTLTATDIAVAAGLIDLGDPALVASLDPQMVAQALTKIRDAIWEGCEQMRGGMADTPIILVGGGRILAYGAVPDGVDVRLPVDGDVANAVGAAIGEVSGSIDRLFDYSALGRDGAVAEAKGAAISSAIEAGAMPETIRIVEVEEIPLLYLPGRSTRVRVKAVGTFAFRSPSTCA